MPSDLLPALLHAIGTAALLLLQDRAARGRRGGQRQEEPRGRDARATRAGEGDGRPVGETEGVRRERHEGWRGRLTAGGTEGAGGRSGRLVVGGVVGCTGSMRGREARDLQVGGRGCGDGFQRGGADEGRVALKLSICTCILVSVDGQ